MIYESVTFPSLITPSAGWSRLRCYVPGGQILLTVSKARGIELLLSSPLVCAAISVGGKFSHCDEGHPEVSSWPPLGSPNPLTFAESAYHSFKLDIIASSFLKS